MARYRDKYRDIIYNVFRKYERMKKIAANPITQKVTVSFDKIVTNGGIKENIVEKLIISKADAEAYIYIIDEAIENLPNTKNKPFQTIIKYRYVVQPHYSAVRLSSKIGYSVDAYFKKLRQAQKELVDILDSWGVDI